MSNCVGDADRALGGEEHDLALAVDLDGDRRGVGRRIVEARPDGPAGVLVERHEAVAVLAAGIENHPAAVDQRRQGVAVERRLGAHLRHEVTRPQRLAAAEVEAVDGAVRRAGVDPSAVDGGGGAGAVIVAEAVLPVLADRRPPALLAGGGVEARQDLVLAVAELGADVAVGDDDAREADADLGPPDLRRSAWRPCVEQAGLGRDAVLVWAAPARPRVGAGGRRQGQYEDRGRDASDSVHVRLPSMWCNSLPQRLRRLRQRGACHRFSPRRLWR
jgi:hypothetical protein